MIRDARPIDDASMPGRMVGLRGFTGSLLIHLMLLVTIVSFDAYLSSPQSGAEAGQLLDPADPLTGGGAATWGRRIADRRSITLMLGTLTDHLLQSTVFVLAASLLALAYRRHGARVRYWIWFGASLKFLVPFTPLIALGSQLEWPATFKSFARHPIVAGIGEPLINANEGLAMLVPMWPGAPSATSAASAGPPLGWIGLSLLVVWASGFLAIVSIRARAWRQVRALLAASKPMQLPDVDIPGDVAVRSAPGLLEPGVVGWQHPVLLMPADIVQHLTPQEIAAIVAHELCHVRRRDNLTASIHMIAEALFWFHPAVWWIGARLVDERERACDEHVLRTMGQPRTYARGILNICKRYVASPLPSVSGVTSSNVKKRIEAILANRVGEAIGPVQKVILGTTVVLVMFIPLGAGAVYAPRFAERIAAAPLTTQDGVTVTPGTSGSGNSEMMFSAAGPGDADPAGGRPASTVAYALVLASADRRLGPGLTPAAPGDCDDAAPDPAERCGVGRVSPGEIVVKGLMPAELAGVIAATIDRPVEDRTGLSGRYTMRLAWPQDRTGRSAFSAVRNQLGLTLVPIGIVERAPGVPPPPPPSALTRDDTVEARRK